MRQDTNDTRRARTCWRGADDCCTNEVVLEEKHTGMRKEKRRKVESKAKREKIVL